MPPADTAIPPYLVTILIGAIVALSGVIVYLFKYYSGKQTDAEVKRREQDHEVAQERMTWALERQKHESSREEYETELRLEYEAKHRTLVESHATLMRELHEDARQHEDLVRREFAQLMEAVESKAVESAGKIATVMDRFYERYVSPRSRMKG